MMEHDISSIRWDLFSIKQALETMVCFGWVLIPMFFGAVMMLGSIFGGISTQLQKIAFELQGIRTEGKEKK